MLDVFYVILSVLSINIVEIYLVVVCYEVIYRSIDNAQTCSA